MLGVQLRERELLDIWSEADDTRRMRVDFPVSSVTGAASTSVVYFELEPGQHCGIHTDSAEEIVLILSGRAEAIVGDERGELSAGGIGLVPALVPHDVRNVGEETVRVVGFFSSATVVSVFDDPLMPVGKRVVGTPLPEETKVAPAGSAPSGSPITA
jgi:quercetin dioxygenase-like cupin family protein